jgi:hypothetical protein
VARRFLSGLAAVTALVQKSLNFLEIQKQVSTHGEIALGVRVHGKESQLDGGIELHTSRDKHWDCSENDEIVLLMTPYG